MKKQTNGGIRCCLVDTENRLSGGQSFTFYVCVVDIKLIQRNSRAVTEGQQTKPDRGS